MLYSLLCGCGFTKDGLPLAHNFALDVQHEALAKAAREFGGATLSQTEGSWLDPKTDKVVTESGFRIDILIDVLSPADERVQTEAVENFAHWLAVALFQDSVVVTRSANDFWFIKPRI